MWLCLQPNESTDTAMPDTPAKVSDLKTESQRLRAALYRVYLHETKTLKYVGIFESYYQEKMQRYITHTLGQLPE